MGKDCRRNSVISYTKGPAWNFLMKSDFTFFPDINCDFAMQNSEDLELELEYRRER